MPIAQLLSPQQLANRQEDAHRKGSKLVILDCRFALDDIEYGKRSYVGGHIAGASFADLEADLSGPIVPGITGRHPLPSAEALVAKLRAWGISNDSEVVFYDDGPGMYAAHAWWLLVWLGKRDGLYILDGGLKAWHAAGFPLTLDPPGSEAGDFTGSADESLTIDAEPLRQQLGRAELTLIDARALPRFRGEVEPIDPVAGHIPGAQCAAFTDNLGADGRFLPAAELQQRFANQLAGRPVEALVAYCGSGVTACHNLFALSLAGYPLARLYAGSWSDWITDRSRPIAVGD